MKNPLEHKFYQDALANFEEARQGQIEQGFKEYGKPYDPANFTATEQMIHFMSELPDILHYGYGMYKTILAKEQEIIELKRQLTIANQELEEANGILNSLRK
jgi:hypothetical protein